MTIAVACNLADGLVMGADSAVTITGSLKTPEGIKSGVLKVYNDAEKLFPLHSLPIGVVSYGAALLQKRTIQSYIREFEHKYSEEELGSLEIAKVAQFLWEFFEEKYRAEFAEPLKSHFGKPLEEIDPRQFPPLGFMIGGFSPNAHLSELWEVNAHLSEDKGNVIQSLKRGQFGSAWRGEVEGIRRFHKGFSFSHLDAIIRSIIKHYNVEYTDELRNIIQPILEDADYKIPWDGMPLQEGVDYVKFCLDMMITQTKFVIGAPTCGGEIRLAVIRGEVTNGEDRFSYITNHGFELRRN